MSMSMAELGDYKAFKSEMREEVKALQGFIKQLLRRLDQIEAQRLAAAVAENTPAQPSRRAHMVNS